MGKRIFHSMAHVLIALGFALAFAFLSYTQESTQAHDWFGYKLELKVLDQMFQSRGAVDIEPNVVIAAIDEDSIDKFGQWGSWDRSLFAQAISNLREAGAEVVAFDVVFSGPAQRSQSAIGRQLVSRLQGTDPLAAGTALVKELSQGQQALAQAQRELEQASLPASALKQLDASSKQSHSQGVQLVRESLNQAQSRLQKGEQQAEALSQGTQALVEAIRDVAQGQSPDDALAVVLEDQADNVVQGYIVFYHPEDDRIAAQADQDAEKISVAAISDIAIGWEIPEQGERVGMPQAGDQLINPKLAVPDILGGFVPPNDDFAEAGSNFGYFSVAPDSDGVIRRVPLVLQYKDQLFPSLSLASVSLLLEAGIVPMSSRIYPHGLESISFSVSPDVVTKLCRWRDKKQLHKVDDCVQNFGSSKMGDGYIVNYPTDRGGALLVNFYGPQKTTFPRLSFGDILTRQQKALAQVKDKIVIVGATAMATHDQRITPFSDFSPGVEVHAAAMQNMIDGSYLQRPTWMVPIEIIGMILVGLLLGLLLKRLSIPLGVLATLALVAGFLLINNYILFRHGYWVYSVLPVGQIFLTWAGLTVFGYLTEGREKKRITQQFGTYVSPDYVKELLANPDVIGLAGQERELTVLFSDIRGFTTMSEKMAPEDLTGFLNEYLTPMTHCLQRHNGTLDKYMGDAIMAFFGAPKWFEDHPVQACLTALEMMADLREMRKKWHAEGKPEIDIGIGLNSGKMRVGNMGSEAMRNYTVLGDNVNLGSRLEGINKQYLTNIIASETTFAAAKHIVFGRELDSVAVKGKKEPVRIYEVMGKGTAQAWQAELIETFEQGLKAYRAMDWGAAIAHFQACMRIKKQATGESDQTSHIYLERVATLKQNPPPADWDGVWKMTTK